MSRLIKPIWSYPEKTEKKVITLKMVGQPELALHKHEEEYAKTPDEILNEAKMEAKQITDRAQAEYDTVLADIQKQRNDWSREKERFISQAMEEGYQAGWQEGQQQGYLEYQQLIKDAQQIIAVAKTDYMAYLDSSEKIILELSLKIAEKILAEKIEEEGSFLSLVKRAIKEIKECQDIRLHIHPQNYEYVQSHKEELLSTFSHQANLFIYPDEELPPGDCVIESEIGRIDAGIDTQLSEIKQCLTELLESES
nr:flagellar assembly protein FliH [uncultured Bacillus sp.]